METTLKDRQAVKATVEVRASAGEVDAAFDRVLREYARQVRVPGFRPGKAPRGVLVRRIGEEALGQEVRESLVDQGYPQAVRDHDLAPLHAHAHGDAPTAGEPFTFEVHVDLYPEFELPEISEIVIDTEAEPISDAQVDETVENLRREHATLVPVERPAEATDQVLIETVDEEGEPREEGSVMPVDMETVGDALAEQLLGHGIGDVVDLTLDDRARTAEDGTPATTTMRVRIADVKEKEKPEPDDEFAKTLGFDDWSAVRDAIRESLENQSKERAGEEQREEFVEKLMEGTEVQLPEILVNRRKMQLLENLTNDLKRQGIDMDAYLANLDEEGKREEFEGELQESAEKGVKRDLVLEKLLEMRGAEVSDEEFEETLRYVAAREGTDPASFRRDRGEEWLRNYRFLLMRDKALRAAVAERLGEADEERGSDAADEDESAPGDDGARADEDDSAGEGTSADEG